MKKKMDDCKCAFDWALEEYLSEYEDMKKDAQVDWREVQRLGELARFVKNTHKVYCICKEEALKEGVYDEEHHDHEDYEYYHKEKKHDGHMAAPGSAHMSPKM